MRGLYKEKPSAKSAFFLHFHSLLNVNRNILHSVQDGPQRGALQRKPSCFNNSFFYAFNLHSSLWLDSVYGIKKPESNDSGFLCSGDRTRTCDLRVMSPTSSQLLHPAMYLHCFISIFTRVIRPMSTSAPQWFLIALFQIFQALGNK